MEQLIAPTHDARLERWQIDDLEREGGACPLCRAPARLLTCWECCDGAWVIECAHRRGAPLMRRGRSDGSDPHRVFCAECAEG